MSRLLVALLPRALIVCDVETVTLPADSALFSLFATVDKRFHTLVVIRICFHQVNDVEAVNFILNSVLNSKEVPLRKAVGTVVILKKEVVFEVGDFNSLPQVGTLETTFKD